LNAQLAGLIGDGVELRDIARHQGNPRTRLGERQCHGLSQTAARAGDERNTSI
jgi:hypothetical protein